MITADDFTRMMWVRFIATKDKGDDVLQDFIADVAKLDELEIGAVNTDDSGEFQREFLAVLTEHSIRQEEKPPGNPQYNGAPERAPGSLQGKNTVMQEGSIDAWRKTFPAENGLQSRKLLYCHRQPEWKLCHT